MRSAQPRPFERPLLDLAYLTLRTTGLVLAWTASKTFSLAITVNQRRARFVPIKIVT